MASKTKTAVAEKKSVYVYLGPSIRGVIQSGTIYSGTKTEVKKTLAQAIERFPKIESLIVEDVDIAKAKEKIKTGGNSMSMAYKSLLA